MELAERHGFPILSLVDIPGAYPGVTAEQHGQGGAIARSQALLARLRVPVVACVIGEGGSGGAIATALADRVLMQENAIYTVISPEGCAAILWRDAGEARKAAAAFKPDAAHCLELGVIDAIVPEPGRARTPTPTRQRGCSATLWPSRSSCWTPSRARSCDASGVCVSAQSARYPQPARNRGLSGPFPHLPQAYPPAVHMSRPACSRPRP